MGIYSNKIKEIREKLGDDLCIMGHHYQCDDVIMHCDIVGDSLELARKIPNISAKYIVFCGVFFMGESAALLSKEWQNVYLPEPDADCMMALMAEANRVRLVIEQLVKLGRKVLPIAYVNTNLALKSVIGEYSGTVCTSANAKTILAWAFSKYDCVLFLPDKNLGRNTAKKLGMDSTLWHILRVNGQGLVEPRSQALDRKLLLWPGCCAIHAKFKKDHVLKAREKYSNCKVIVHPECDPEVVDISDGNGSTSYLIEETAKLSKEYKGGHIVVGTENNLVYRLAKRHGDSCYVHPLGDAFCPHMDKVNEEKLYNTLQNIMDNKATAVKIDQGLSNYAKQSLERMLDVCSIKVN